MKEARPKSPHTPTQSPISPLDINMDTRTTTIRPTANLDHCISSSTDDDEANPSAWTTDMRKSSRTKRPRTSILTATNLTCTSQPTTSTINTDFTTRNPFTLLPTDDITPEQRKPVVPPSPPPIYIKEVLDFASLRADLNNIIGQDSYTTKSTHSGGLQIKTNVSDSYSTVMKYLTARQADFHTYQKPTDKTHRVVIRHLHHSTPTSLISDELTNLGYSVRHVNNTLHRQTKQPLPLFFIDLEPTDNIQSIYNLTVLLNTRITVEEPRRRTDLPQCHRCQQYSHTKSYCHHAPKCVRCGGDHVSSSCSKPRDTPAKCALCSNSHPANYKGCSVYRDLQKKRNTASGTKTQASTSHVQKPEVTLLPSVHTSSSPVNIIPSTSYVNSYTPVTTVLTPETRPMSYAQATLHRRTTQDNLPAPPTNDLTRQLSGFLDEMKNLLTPIVSLLTAVITELLKKNDK